jgi:lysine 6-dehydrogenase
MLVLGAGLQGTACAYDLLQNPSVTRVLLADVQVGTLPAFLAPFAGARLEAVALDVRDAAAVRALFARCDGVMSAIPYYFNASLAAIAVEMGVHFTDLGGNTAIVQEQTSTIVLYPGQNGKVDGYLNIEIDVGQA